MAKSIFSIREAVRGGRPLADDFNAVVAALKGIKSPGVGFSHEIMFASAPPQPREQGAVMVQCNEEIPPYSIFAVSGAPSYTPQYDASKTYVRKVAVDAMHSPLGLFTNGSLRIPENTPSWARSIGYGSVYKIAFTGGQPAVGEAMGVRPGTFTLEGDGKHRHGLVCVASDSTHAWVVRAGGSFLVKADGDITAMSGTTLGEGDGIAYYRDADSSDVTESVLYTDTEEPTSFTVFNCGELIPDGSYTRAVAIEGVGLVVERTSPAEPLRGATWLTGTQLVQSVSDVHCKFQFGIADTPFSLTTHVVGAPTLDGFKIEAEGRYLIVAQVSIEASSPPGSIVINNGDDLVTKIGVHEGEVRIVRNDNPAAPDGTESLEGELYGFDVIGAHKRYTVTIVSMGWHDIDDTIKLWLNPVTVDGGDAETFLSINVRMGAIYLGDFDDPWDA